VQANDIIISGCSYNVGEHSGSEAAIGKLRGLLLMQKEKDNVKEVQKEKANVKEVQYFKMGEQKGVEKE
jgi:hypothetical protein